MAKCSLDDMAKYLCIKNYKNDTEGENQNIGNEIQKNIQEDLINGTINTTKIAEEGFEFQDGNTKFSVTTTDAQKNKESNNNETTINLGECENILRRSYGIPEEAPLFLFLIEVYEEGYQAPKIEYEAYYPFSGNKLEKLELNLCQNSKVEFLISVDADEKNLDQRDPNSKFYNDICYTYKSDRGTDISLKDRINLYIKNKLTLCEDGCEFKGLDPQTKKAKCSCQIKIKFPLISEIKIDKERLSDSISEIDNISNLKLLKCYYVLFSKKGIINNYGCFIMIPIVIIYFISVILFYSRGYNNIKNKIKEIIYVKKNWNILNDLLWKEREKQKEREKEKEREKK